MTRTQMERHGIGRLRILAHDAETLKTKAELTLEAVQRHHLGEPGANCSMLLRKLLAYMVARRRREIGIRMALGAQHGQILRMVLGDALRLVSIGLALALPPARRAAHVDAMVALRYE